MITRRSDCRLCHSRDFNLILQLNPSALANAFVKDPSIKQEEFPLDLFQCKSCGHYQLLDVVDPNVMFKDYCYVSGTSKVMRQHFRNYACSIVSEYDLEEDDLVCDIGSNDGTLLKYFKCFGMNVIGVDPAENLVQNATAQGVTTITAFFDRKVAQEIKEKYGLAKVITCNNCFAHSDNLDEIVLGVKELLSEDGIFIFEVSYFKNVIENIGFDQIYHEHLSYHSILPLHLFFTQHGMTIFDIERVNVHGGSIRCFVKNKDYRLFKNGECWLDETLYFSEQEEKYGLYTTDSEYSSINKFTRKIEQNKQELKDKLNTLKQSGARIAAVAASAKSTTFLHHYEIGTDLIDYICDDAPEKQGLFTPGKHIPVVPFSKIYEDNPDYLLILSFNFVYSIVNKHKDFKGRWIIPSPNLTIGTYGELVKQNA